MDSSVGGLIQGISLGAFLQMVQMEKKTCTLTIRSAEGIGRLYIYNGDLVSAETETHKNKEAAYEILGWDDTLIEIDDTCLKKEKEIDQPLMSILMEGLKAKDEKDSQDLEALPPAEPENLPPQAEPADPDEGLNKLQMADENVEAAATPSGDIPLSQIEDLSGVPPTGGEQQTRNILAEKRKVAEEIERKSRPMREAAAKEAAKIKKQRIKLASIAAVTLLIIGVAATIAFHKFQEKRTQERYTIAITRAESTTLLEDKEDVLLDFVDNYPSHPEISKVREMLSEVQKKIENRDFEETVKRVESIPMGDDFVKKAISAYQDFLKKYPKGYNAEDVRARIDNIPNLLDDRDFAEIKKQKSEKDSIKIKAYAQYLAKHPNGAHRKKVEALIAEMSEEYYVYLKNEIEECDENEVWQPCILLCTDFADLFVKSPHTKKVNAEKKMMIDKQDYAGLKEKEAELSPDHNAVIEMYRSYLKKNPSTYRAKSIKKDIATLQKIETEKKDWEKVRVYATNTSVTISKRILKVKQYIKDTTTNTYLKESRALLNDLEIDKAQATKQQSANQNKIQKQQSVARQQQEQKRIQSEINKVTQKLKATDGRFVAVSRNIVKDKKTGLMWMMLDSKQLTGKCVTHANALKHVRSLKTGGYSDWRLPKPNELVVIYKNKPFFPSSGSAWYWTADVYQKGYHQIADIVTTKAETAWQRKQKRTDQCGTVRAVRP